ncbi:MULTISPECIES: MFS transporter [Nocardiopsidaceae]|uniref:MFS transporter n=1 Tax=Streptomonospora nanhaiensis TaxID=1323731 RepID=A0ABY6YIR1_9ACTN|nr:MFS transporter [Streptomonospora nanhaiensis]WAE72118.1 MFS transporter [Streptomonospora nanhaiensis]
MSPIETLRRMHRIAGWPLLLASFLARLPISMALIGMLTLVTATTGSVAAAGAVAGAFALGEAVGGPVIARFADRHGQRTPVLVMALVDAVLIVLLVLAVRSGTPTPALAALAAVTGMCLPQMGPMARTRWVVLIRRGPDRGAERERSVSAAMSVEGVLDEAAFVLGPALVGVLTVTLSPSAGVLGAAALIGVFGAVFALHRTAPAGTPPVRGSEGRIATPALLVLTAPMFCQGLFFGGMSTGVTAFAAASGYGDLSGLMYAVMGASSAAAGLLMASLPAGFSLTARTRVAAGGLFVLSLPLYLDHGPATLAVAVFVLGAAIGPHIVSLFGLIERAAPPSRLSQSMAVVLSSLILGQALGSVVSGAVADAYGHQGAFALATLGGLVSFAVAVLVMRARWYARTGEARDEPGAGAKPSAAPSAGTRAAPLAEPGDPGNIGR